MSQQTSRLFKAFDSDALKQFERDEQARAQHHGQQQSMHQRAADAARKELRRRREIAGSSREQLTDRRERGNDVEST